jgi:hypothetical protein
MNQSVEVLQSGLRHGQRQTIRNKDCNKNCRYREEFNTARRLPRVIPPTDRQLPPLHASSGERLRNKGQNC